MLRLGVAAFRRCGRTPIPSSPPSAAQIASRAFYPLTLPITVGPGTISVAITIGANHPRNVHSLLINGTADAIGAALIALTVFACYRYADLVLRRLGETGTSVLVRLSAFILFCIGVQILWNGASALLADLPVPPVELARFVVSPPEHCGMAGGSSICYNLTLACAKSFLLRTHSRFRFVPV